MVLHEVLKRELQAAGAAFQLLTRIPVPAAIPFTPQVLARSTVYYPIIGMVIGVIVAAAAAGMDGRVPPLPAAVLLLALWLALSGGLHMDGLMDTADGALSNRSRERMLEIMKDSRVGAMGALAAIVLLLFKFSTLASMMDIGTDWLAIGTWIAFASGLSRLWIVIAMVAFPVARPGEGMASSFAGVRSRHAAAAMAVQAVLTGLAFWLIPEACGQWAKFALVSVIAATVFGWGTARWLTRKLGGLTGDTYGAMTETIEAALLFVIVLLS